MYPQATAIGVDLGRFFINTAIVRYDGKVLIREKNPLPERLTRLNVIKTLTFSVNSIREKAAVERINPLAIGISAPGFIDHDHGIVLGPDHGVRGWKNVLLSSIISEKTGLPVYVGNDANLMTVAEHKFGAAKNYKHVIFIALRTGIGGGIIIDGKLYRGVNNTGGEIGMMIIDKGETGDIMQGKGTLEEFASGAALVKRYLQVKGKKQGGSVNLRAKDIFDLSASGDKAAITVVSENARFVGIGLANLVSIFAPEIIVIGGGMALTGGSYISEIKKHTFANSLSYCSKGLKIELAKLGADAAVIGSSWYALNRFDGK